MSKPMMLRVEPELHEQSGEVKSVHAVPSIPQRKLPSRNAIYCFPPGTSEADKQHDIEQIEKFIEHVKAKKQLTGGKRKE